MPEIPKAYDPKKVEDKIYKTWEKSGFFNPDNLPEENIKKNKNGEEKTYTIVLPPPNITAKLHLGHSMMLAIEDLLIRYHRMKGYRTLWIPGTDHAAIATQNVVEKKLLKEEGLTRHDLGREKFLKKVWEYLEETQAVILNQTRKMGASLDWSREAFTLDKQREKAVRKMFVDMYAAGVIYRGERIVNWCPRCQSTLADDEVEYKEQKAKLYTFKYSRDFPFAIATTRPETKLGDTAVAVNPKDGRYKKHIGKIYEVDFVGIKLKLKIIADRHVEMEFGTGALGVTPAHSMADWQMAEENNLEIIKVIGEDGKIKNNFSEYSNKSVEEAREMIVENLRKNNLLEKEEEIENNLSLCYRCNTAIEPLPSKQWFVNVDKKLKFLGNKSLKEKAIVAAKNKSIKFIPKRFKKRYLDWMENLHDWCISRQIWFGHRIPVWYRTKSQIQNSKSQINSKFKIQNSKVWELKIYGEDIFNALKENKKTIETRAGKQKGSDKYWGDFKRGDVVKFSLADEKTDSIVKSVAPVEKIINKVTHFKTIEEMLEVLDLSKIAPNSSVEEYKKMMESFPEFKERLEKYGVWAMELKDGNVSDSSIVYTMIPKNNGGNKDGEIQEIEDQEIYVGTEPPKGGDWVQDEDSLDTWFSSGMWTFSTLGWPDNFKDGKKINDLAKFHPTQVLETGYEILTLWVSRMIMMSLFALQEIPFENVYLHGMLLDKRGKKMSKSRGNGIDPIDMIEKYGADAARLSLLTGMTPGNDIRFFEEKIEGQRNFVNKLWNVSRFVLSGHTENKEIKKLDIRKLEIGNLSLADKWILGKLDNLIKEITDDLENYNFSPAGEKLRDFTWNDFADWYLEISKIEKNKDEILVYVLETILKLWHPFIPFVTEEIWKNIKPASNSFQEGNARASKNPPSSFLQRGDNNLLMIEKWPSGGRNFSFPAAEDDFELIKNIIVAIRNARTENKVEPSRKINAIIHAGDKNKKKLLESQADLIKGMRTGIDKLEIKETGKKIDKAAYIIVNKVEIYLTEMIDEEKEERRINKEIGNLEKLIDGASKKLSNEEFVKKAPPQVVKQERAKLKTRREELENLKKRLSGLKQI